jgi:GNAT superfamily N-acetyltransferase
MLRVRAMTEADIALGMRLKGQAGWNQLEPDWRRALQLQPDGCFVAELDGMAAATTTTCIFGSVAWIALVLVDEALRGRGIGTALMNAALAFLDRSACPAFGWMRRRRDGLSI